MYIDIALFFLGGLSIALTGVLICYLLLSHHKSREYRNILKQESEVFDAYTATSKFIKNTIAESYDQTEFLTLNEDKTELLSINENIDIKSNEPEGFKALALEGRYNIERRITQSTGMSKVFVARSLKLGNLWIVKFISNKNGKIAGEENILKLLNHISLPKIIDIFHDENGAYLVESFVEGVTLSKVLSTGQKINQEMLLNWAEQLAQVLSYLHEITPNPIFHLDLKPSNIMVTHDNKLVLIDFGISKMDDGTENKGLTALTYQYAAPEQFKHEIKERFLPIIETRFKALPSERFSWRLDSRTDIYSLGVVLFEIATGKAPTINNKELLRLSVTEEVERLILKCLEINPINRYQSSRELLKAINLAKGQKTKMIKTLFMRKIALFATIFSFIISTTSFASGGYIYQQEKQSVVDIEPDAITLSLQQTADFVLKKTMPNGEIYTIDQEDVAWLPLNDGIISIDGKRIVGLNVGHTELSGIYRHNKIIKLNVSVVEPIEEEISISQRFKTGRIVEVFVGTTKRERIDGKLSLKDKTDSCELISPTSIAITDDNVVYFSDAGVLRVIKDNKLESIYFEPEYLTPKIVRTYKNDVYMLTDEWEDEEGLYYGIIKLGGENLNIAEAVFLTEAVYSSIQDFTISNSGQLYFIERTEPLSKVYLNKLDLSNNEIETLCELEASAAGITADDNANIYISNTELGTISKWSNGTLLNFAGVKNENAFIDGTLPKFYMPSKLHFVNDSLYVWDFNVLRKIAIENDVMKYAESIVGEASPAFEADNISGAKAENIILPNSMEADFIIDRESIDSRGFITDPKRGVIWAFN